MTTIIALTKNPDVYSTLVRAIDQHFQIKLCTDFDEIQQFCEASDLVLVDLCLENSLIEHSLRHLSQFEVPGIALVKLEAVNRLTKLVAAGIKSFVYYEDISGRLCDCIYRTLAGSPTLLPAVAANILESVKRRGYMQTSDLEILRQLSFGKSNMAIAESLGVGAEIISAKIWKICAHLKAQRQ